VERFFLEAIQPNIAPKPPANQYSHFNSSILPHEHSMRICVIVSPWRSNVTFGSPCPPCGSVGISALGICVASNFGAAEEIGLNRVGVAGSTTRITPGSNGTNVCVIIPTSGR
jgi:hypothetical protein